MPVIAAAAAAAPLASPSCGASFGQTYGPGEYMVVMPECARAVKFTVVGETVAEVPDLGCGHQLGKLIRGVRKRDSSSDAKDHRRFGRFGDDGGWRRRLWLRR